MQLAPSSKWVVEYADDRCRLARQFGEGKQLVTLLMDRYGPGDTFKITLTGPIFRQVSDESTVKIQFGPNEGWQTPRYFLGTTGEKIPALFLIGSLRIAPTDPEEQRTLNAGLISRAQAISGIRVAAVDYFEIGRPLRQPTRLALGSMKGPFLALDKCVDELMTHWGVDVAKFKTQSRPLKAVANSGPWLVDDDYPPGMIARGRRALINVRAIVAATGKPSACFLQQSTGPKDFDDAVCRAFMRRARFDPALDADGKPFASVYRQSITFQMP